MAGSHTLLELERLLEAECPRELKACMHGSYIHLEWYGKIHCVKMGDGTIELQELGMQPSLAERLWKDYDLSKRGFWP